MWATSRSDVYLSCDGAIVQWDALRRRTRRALDLERGAHGLGRVQVSTMAAHAPSGLLAAGGFNGELLVAPLPSYDDDVADGSAQTRPWRAAGAAPHGLLHAARITADENGITNAIEICTGGAGGAPLVVASNNDAHVRCFDAAAMRLASAMRFPWAVNCTAMAPGGSCALVVGDHPAAAVVDLRAGATVATLAGHLDYSFAAAWHPGGTLLATGSQDTTARVWDLRRTAHALTVLKGRMSAIRSVRFSPGSGAILALAEAADFVHLLPCGGKDAFAREQLVDLFGELAGVSFSPDGGALFVGVADMTYGSLLEFSAAAPRRAAYLPL